MARKQRNKDIYTEFYILYLNRAYQDPRMYYTSQSSLETAIEEFRKTHQEEEIITAGKV